MEIDSSSSPSPIVFAAPGLTPDVSLKIFSQEFHVHSVVLKLHSAFFRRFLDSPEKDGPLLGQFAYQYVTVLDDDMWALEPAAKATPASPSVLESFPQSDEETKAFHRILCAMYNRPYTIASLPDLRILVRLADFYCTLPVVSASLTACLMLSVEFANDIFPQYGISDPPFGELLLLAKQLRNETLFRDAFCHAVGVYDQTNEDQFLIKDPKMLDMVRWYHIKLTTKIISVQQHLLLPMMQEEFGKACFAECKKYMRTSRPGTINRLFYYNLLDMFHPVDRIDPADYLELYDGLHELVIRRPILPKSRDAAEYFTCTELEDSHLPWDPEETDW